MNSMAQRLCAAHRDAGMPPPDPALLESLNSSNANERYFWRRLARSYVTRVEQLTTVQRERAALVDLRDRVLVAEAAIRGGADHAEVETSLRLRPDQMQAVLANEPVQP